MFARRPQAELGLEIFGNAFSERRDVAVGLDAGVDRRFTGRSEIDAVRGVGGGPSSVTVGDDRVRFRLLEAFRRRFARVEEAVFTALVARDERESHIGIGALGVRVVPSTAAPAGHWENGTSEADAIGR